MPVRRDASENGGASDRQVDRAVAAAFGFVAAIRGRPAVHALGAAFSGTAAIHDAGAALATSTGVPAVVRFSRGIGLPHPMPDVNGVAVRLVDAHGSGRHQDLLFASAGAKPVLRHIILPVTWFSTSGYSTIVPFRSESSRRVVFRCDPLPVRTLGEIESNLPLSVTVRVASLAAGWEPAATVTLTAPVALADEEVRFDPWNTSESLMPAGLLNRLRPAAYAASRAASGRRGDERSVAAPSNLRRSLG